MKQSSWMTASVLAVALAALVGFSVWQKNKSENISAARCEASSGLCENNAGAQLNFSGPIVVNKPLMLRLDVPEQLSTGQTWQGHLEGRDMYMGITPVTLKASAESHHYQGELRIPICTTENMAWRLVLTSSDGSESTLTYEFLISQP